VQEASSGSSKWSLLLAKNGVKFYYHPPALLKFFLQVELDVPPRNASAVSPLDAIAVWMQFCSPVLKKNQSGLDFLLSRESVAVLVWGQADFIICSAGQGKVIHR